MAVFGQIYTILLIAIAADCTVQRPYGMQNPYSMYPGYFDTSKMYQRPNVSPENMMYPGIWDPNIFHEMFSKNTYTTTENSKISNPEDKHDKTVDSATDSDLDDIEVGTKMTTPITETPTPKTNLDFKLQTTETPTNKELKTAGGKTNESANMIAQDKSDNRDSTKLEKSTDYVFIPETVTTSPIQMVPTTNMQYSQILPLTQTNNPEGSRGFQLLNMIPQSTAPQSYIPTVNTNGNTQQYAVLTVPNNNYVNVPNNVKTIPNNIYYLNPHSPNGQLYNVVMIPNNIVPLNNNQNMVTLTNQNQPFNMVSSDNQPYNLGNQPNSLIPLGIQPNNLVAMNNQNNLLPSTNAPTSYGNPQNNVIPLNNLQSNYVTLSNQPGQYVILGNMPNNNLVTLPNQSSNLVTLVNQPSNIAYDQSNNLVTQPNAVVSLQEQPVNTAGNYLVSLTEKDDMKIDKTKEVVSDSVE